MVRLKFASYTFYTRLFLGVIIAFSLIVGMVGLYQFRDTPFFTVPVLDELSYVEWATEIAGGEVLGDKVFYQEPLYPYFLALLFRAFGPPEIGGPHPSWFFARLVQVLMGTLAVVLVFSAGKRLGGNLAGLSAALILAFSRTVYFFELLFLKTGLLLFLSALCCFLGVAAAEDPERKWRWPTIGFLAGLLCLLRGNFLLLLPLFIAFAFFAVKKDGALQRSMRSFLVLVGIFVALFPVGARNYIVGEEFVLTTSQGGANFYIGNNEIAGGVYVHLPFVNPHPRYEGKDFKREAEKRTGRGLSYSEVSRFWFKEGLSWMGENPVRASLLWLHKARLLVHNFEVPDNYNIYLVRDHFVSALKLPFLGIGLIWGAAFLGFAVFAGKRRAVWYPAIFLLAYPASLLPFFVLSRYRLAALPAAAIFAGLFVLWTKEKSVKRQWLPLICAAVFLAVTYPVSMLPIEESRGPHPYSYYNIGNAYLKTGNFEEALRWYDIALQHVPGDRDVLENRRQALEKIYRLHDLTDKVKRQDLDAQELADIGKEFEKLDRPSFAVTAYEKALEKDPANLWALARLGYLYHERPEVRDLDKAFRCLHKALAIQPGNPELMVYLGSCYRLSGDKEEAQQWWRRALKVRPGYPLAVEKLEKYSR